MYTNLHNLIGEDLTRPVFFMLEGSTGGPYYYMATLYGVIDRFFNGKYWMCCTGTAGSTDSDTGTTLQISYVVGESLIGTYTGGAIDSSGVSFQATAIPSHAYLNMNLEEDFRMYLIY